MGPKKEVIFPAINTKKFNNEIFNICGGSKISLRKLIFLIEKITKKKIKIKLKSFQRGDMYKTHGNNGRLMKNINNTACAECFCKMHKLHGSRPTIFSR